MQDKMAANNMIFCMASILYCDCIFCSFALMTQRCNAIRPWQKKQPFLTAVLKTVNVLFTNTMNKKIPW
jgi:hypothetical protein